MAAAVVVSSVDTQLDTLNRGQAPKNPPRLDRFAKTIAGFVVGLALGAISVALACAA